MSELVCACGHSRYSCDSSQYRPAWFFSQAQEEPLHLHLSYRSQSPPPEASQKRRSFTAEQHEKETRRQGRPALPSPAGNGAEFSSLAAAGQLYLPFPQFFCLRRRAEGSETISKKHLGLL